MKKNMSIFMLALILILNNYSMVFASDNQLQSNIQRSSINIDNQYSNKVNLNIGTRTRGSLDDFCKAGMKQYCPENRSKLYRDLTYREKKCIVSLGFATMAALSSMNVLGAISSYGLAIVSCLP